MTEASTRTTIISVLNDNDVLLGRGRGSGHHVGNERFRALTRLRKKEYKLCNNNDRKTSIAYELYEEVVDNRGGRFLQLVNDGNPSRAVLETGQWKLASLKASIKKCKQALREKDDPDNEASEDDGKKCRKRRNAKNQGPLKRQKISSKTETQPPRDQVPFQTHYLPVFNIPGTTPPPMLAANTAGTGSSIMNQSLVRMQQNILFAQHQAMMQRRVAMNGLAKSMHSRSGSSQDTFRNSIPIVGRLVRPPLSALAARPMKMMVTPMNVMSPFVSRDSSLIEIEKDNASGRSSRPLVAVAPGVQDAPSASTLAMNDKPAPAPRDNPCITEAEKDAVSGLFTLAVAVGNEPNSDGR